MITPVNFYTLYCFQIFCVRCGYFGTKILDRFHSALHGETNVPTNTGRQPDGGAGNRVISKTLDFKSTELMPSPLVSFYCKEETNTASQLLVVYLGLETYQDF